VSIFLIYNNHVWGLPLVMVAIAMAAYTIITILVWYVHGPEGLNRYAYTMLGGEPRMLSNGLPNIRDALVNNSAGLLGRFMNILLTTVFPYIVLGSLFGVSAGGQALIKIAFLWTRRLRGGPAHAAIISSAMFGTISGGPVVNVMSTGVLTIPMMLKRGFSRTFAGGIEAAASSGGQIMPPVMGVAAFILASMTNVPYSEVIVAALIPAIAFFGALFLAVLFQARKQGIEAVGQVTDDMRMTRQDWLHLVMIALPILVILILLLTPKETVGCGLMGTLMGVERVATETGCRVGELPWLMQVFRNSAGSSGAAGWWACMILIALFFLDRDIRRHPGRLLRAFAEAGVSVSGLYLMFLAVSVVDFCLNLTGLSGFIARDFLALLQDFGGLIQEAGLFFFVALLVTMLLAVLLGMGMPSVPAYINVALIMGPLLSGLGISIFTANMFIFYFAVASSITPPIAVAAFAAATITKADPMRTGFAAVRLGVVMFVIPFIFCYYPELLLIEPAQLAPAGGAEPYLPGYDGTVDVVPLALLVGRLAFGLYLLASAIARFDRKALSLTETGLRLVLAALVMATSLAVYGPALVAGVAVIAWHYRGAFPRRAAAG